MQIRYTQVGGIFFVNLVESGQHMVCQRRFFSRITGVSENALIGCIEVDKVVVEDLGFTNVPTSRQTEVAV